MSEQSSAAVAADSASTSQTSALVFKKKKSLFSARNNPSFVFAEDRQSLHLFSEGVFNLHPAAAICRVMESRRGCRTLLGGGRHETWSPCAPSHKTLATLTLCSWRSFSITAGAWERRLRPRSHLPRLLPVVHRRK